MIVEQAIFTSAETQFARGYHLVSRSPGITADVIPTLNRWCPSHASLLRDAEDAASLNFHPLDAGRFVLSRTMHGAQEFSNRGGRQVVTVLLVLDQGQLDNYRYNPLAIARVALSLGYLRLPVRFPAQLPRVVLPDKCESESMRAANTSVKAPCLEEASRLLRGDDSVAIVAAQRVHSIVEQILLTAPVHERRQLSFTTGLRPSRQRPFRLHVLNTADTDTLLALSSLHLHCLAVN